MKGCNGVQREDAPISAPAAPHQRLQILTHEVIELYFAAEVGEYPGEPGCGALAGAGDRWIDRDGWRAVEETDLYVCFPLPATVRSPNWPARSRVQVTVSQRLAL